MGCRGSRYSQLLYDSDDVYDAMAMAREAIEAHLEILEEDVAPIPTVQKVVDVQWTLSESNLGDNRRCITRLLPTLQAGHIRLRS